MENEKFEALLKECRGALERLVHFKISMYADAEDVIQESCITAYRSAGQLRDEKLFRGWILQIGRSRIADYYRKKSRSREDAVEIIPERATGNMRGRADVENALMKLNDRDREVLRLYYMEEMGLRDVAARLNVPEGTVKSRLFGARERFRSEYRRWEDIYMKKMPEKMPGYEIEWLDETPFEVDCEENIGWFIVPKVGEKLNWGIYDRKSGLLENYFEMKATCKAVVHGEEGVEVETVQTWDGNREERTFVMQLKDGYSRILAETDNIGGVKHFYTFLDGDEFHNNWGFGEDNCGRKIRLAPEGVVKREGNAVVSSVPREVMDIVGRAKVTIGGVVFDTVCMMDVMAYEGHVVSEQFIDKNGRTVLWRRFNRNDWKAAYYGGQWSEILPNNDRLVVNGETFVHWYDCITDYIF